MGDEIMHELQIELDRLLGELAELDRNFGCRSDDSGNISLMILARRGTKTAIAEVRRQMAQIDQSHSSRGTLLLRAW